jgi:hypothetical protein
MIANLADFFGDKVLFPGGRLEAFALILTTVSFVLLQRFKVSIYLTV